MKKIVTLLLGLTLLFSFTACSRNNGNADKGTDGIIEDAGNAANDVLNGAENAIDDVTGSNNNNNNSMNNSAQNTDTQNNN